MLFNSYDFMLFFPIVIIIYFIIPKRTRYIWLLIASYYFYMGWNPKYALLIALSTVITFFSGTLMDKVSGNSDLKTVVRRKKLIVAGSFITNILISF